MTDRTRAYSFQIATCDDPNCGAHFIAFDENDREITQITVQTSAMLDLIKTCQAILYEKTVELDDKPETAQ